MEGEDVNASPFYKDRAEWSDVKPLYPSKEECGVVRIVASENFTDAFAYLRAVLLRKELSERAFDLTSECIQLNPANYTIWQYRRDLLEHLNKDLDDELKYVGDIIMENPKNYQVWHHRRVIVERLNDPKNELYFTAVILEDEPKNYHAWQHRQWVVRHFNLANDDEVAFASKLIFADPRNNSAWNYRYFVIQRMDKWSDSAVLDREIQLCKEIAEKIPHNESVWNYLSGILISVGVNSRPDLLEWAETLLSKNGDRKSPYLLSFIVDICMEKIDAGDENAVLRVKELLIELCELDPIRRNYWNYLKVQAENMRERYQLNNKQF